MFANTDNQEAQPPSLADIVREETEDGRLIVRFLLDVMQGLLEQSKPCHRLDAARQLSNLGFHPAQSFIDANTPAAPTRKNLRAHGVLGVETVPLHQELAALIREETDNGLTTVRFLVDAMQGTIPDFKPHHRLSAAKELLRRGFDNPASSGAGHSAATESDPEQSDPEQSDPEQSDPEQSDPEQSDPEQSDPEQSDPEQSDPEQSDPEQSDPEQSDPEQSDPEQSDPEQSDPEQSDPEQSDPEQSDPEQSDPEQSDPEQSDPEQSDPEQSDPEQSDPEQSDPEQSDPAEKTTAAPCSWTHILEGRYAGYPVGYNRYETEYGPFDFRSYDDEEYDFDTHGSRALTHISGGKEAASAVQKTVFDFRFAAWKLAKATGQDRDRCDHLIKFPGDCPKPENIYGYQALRRIFGTEQAARIAAWAATQYHRKQAALAAGLGPETPARPPPPDTIWDQPAEELYPEDRSPPALGTDPPDSTETPSWVELIKEGRRARAYGGSVEGYSWGTIPI